MYSAYYVQDDTDDGLLLDTKIPIKEVPEFFLSFRVFWIAFDPMYLKPFTSGCYLTKIFRMPFQKEKTSH